jgi:hypothetical protein
MSKLTITREDLERWANCTAATPVPISSDMWLARVVAFSEAKENSPKLARLVLDMDVEIVELRFKASMKDKAIRLALKRLEELTDQTGTGALFASDIALIRQAI